MKRYTTMLALFSIILLYNACMDRKSSLPKEEDKLDEVKEIQNESMEKYKEWSEGEDSKDSTQIKKDSASLKLVGRSLQF